MIIIEDTEVLYTMFSFVRDAVINDGGDGGGWIVCVDPLAYADKFYKWEDRMGCPWFRRGGNDKLTFSHGQEYITFTSGAVPRNKEGRFIDTVLVEC